MYFLCCVVCLLCLWWLLVFFLRAKEPSYDKEAIRRCLDELRQWTSGLRLPVDHDLNHFVKVFQHALRAVTNMHRKMKLTRDEITSILLAALNHDADDVKLKKELPPQTTPYTTEYPNAYHLLIKSGCEKYVDLVLEMISLVSASKNGNRMNLPENQRWKYIPRDADRLEALGAIGIKRVATGVFRARMPFRVDATPLPTSHEELRLILQSRPLEKYIENKGKSASMLDHFYDKLLHLNVVASANAYIRQENERRMIQMTNWLFSVNRTLKISDLFQTKVDLPSSYVELERLIEGKRFYS
jgi:HD superfamily phosphodiesterase